MNNYIELLYHLKDLDKIEGIDKYIETALVRWNEKDKLRNIAPEFLVFSYKNKEIIEKNILNLKVVYENNMLKDHFSIRGILDG